MLDYDLNEYTRYNLKGEFDKAIHTLEGILKGISIDDEVNLKELNELAAWCYSNYQFIDRQPYKELIPFIEEAIEDEYLDDEERENILWYCNNFKSDNIFYDVLTSDIQRLQGMMHGILADNRITTEEIKNLDIWVKENHQLKGVYPYDELVRMIDKVLLDGKVDEKEEKILKIFFKDHIIPAKFGSIKEKEIEYYKKEITLDGVCSIGPDICFERRVFTFTGRSSKAKRSEMIDIVTKKNGFHTNIVSKDTDYLIVCDNNNPCWAFSCYGRKVENAVQLKKDGGKIIIAKEEDFWRALKAE